MAKSILQQEKFCFFCGSKRNLEDHHIFGGALRNISERNGFKVWLCHFCHNEPPFGVHFDAERARMLKRACQGKYEITHSRQDWMNLIGRNYKE